MAGKIGRNKKSCEKYRLSGRREENKRLKQERDKKRRERFEKRREEGKAYKPNKEKTISKIKAAYDTKSEYFHDNEELLLRELFAANKGSNRSKHTHFSRWRSINSKLDREVANRKMEMKKFSKKNGSSQNAAA